jgi:hypothetical protein
MAETSMDAVRQAVRMIVAALHLHSVDEDEVHELALRIGHTGKLQVVYGSLNHALKNI